MRTLFIGGTKRGYLPLKALLDTKCNIVGIINLQQDKHEIERYETSKPNALFNGLVSHVNYRATDKEDIGPAFDWNRVIEGVTSKIEIS